MGFETAGIIADTFINPVMQHLTNVKNRKFTREMYKTQRQDALSDWEMQNAYNSPMAQMERFKNGGLNPHLIYGQGNEAAPVRSSAATSGSADAPRSNVSGGLMAMYDMRMREATIDQTKEATENLIKQRSVMDADIIAKLKAAGLSDVRIAEITQNMGMKATMFPEQFENLRLSNQKQRQEIDIAWQRNFREALMNESNLQKQAEEIASLIKGRQKTDEDIARIRQEIALMRKEGILKDFDIAYRKAGNNPQDPAVVKIYNEIARRLGISDIVENIGDWIHGGKRWKLGETLPAGGAKRPTWRATDSQ